MLDMWVAQEIQSTIGQWDMYERASAGPSQARELQLTKGRLEKLEADFLAGEYDGEGQEESYKRMHKSLSAKVALLEKREAERMSPALWATGKKYGEVWGVKDQEDRREFLRAYQVKVWVWKDAIPNAGFGIVMDLGDIQAMAHELKLNKEEGVDRLLTGHNVPAHWITPTLREFAVDDVPAILQV